MQVRPKLVRDLVRHTQGRVDTPEDGWKLESKLGQLTLLYKHSPRCGISFEAEEEVSSFALEEPAVAVLKVDVVRQRPLSDALARALAVAHHSPQVILLDGPTPVWHTSHSRIRSAALQAQVRPRLP